MQCVANDIPWHGDVDDDHDDDIVESDFFSFRGNLCFMGIVLFIVVALYFYIIFKLNRYIGNQIM